MNEEASAGGNRDIVRNRKARYDFEIIDSFEAGIVLVGTEVKSLRAGKVNLKDGFASVEKGEVVLHSVHISPYEPANRYNHDPERPRKLLLHRAEIRRLIGRAEQKGLTLVPLKIYFNARGLVKVQLGLCRGLQLHDKREKLTRTEMARDVSRAIRRGR